ncbi:MAG TPA: tryptophan synthase subunit alpha, partial [Thermoanaerobaculia bacterium]
MSGISEVFARCAEEGRAAFIPFLMAGDPSLSATAGQLAALAAGGADIIELGVPFSDPIADGPVNQRAAMRALAAGTGLSGILELIARHRDQLGVPIVLFTYYNPVYARGLERFAEQAAASGVDGVLCVDLPPEEAERDLVPVLRERGVDTIFLLAPTSTRDRIARVAAASSGFVY